MSDGDWFAVVDCARDPRLFDVVQATAEHSCLYSGDYDDATAATLPYLVRMSRKDRLFGVWSENESGRYWGILIRSTLPLASLRRELRHFTMARLPKGEVVLFRFWDPRVFVPFAKAAIRDEIAPLFKTIHSIVADLGDGERYVFSWNEGLMVNGKPHRSASHEAA